MDALVRKIKENGGDKKIIKEYKSKEYAKKRALRSVEEAQSLMRIFENMKKFINDTEGKVINYIVDDNPDKMFYRNVFLDAAQAVKVLAAMEDIDENNIFATGASQGGALTVACAALSPILKAVEGVVGKIIASHFSKACLNSCFIIF